MTTKTTGPRELDDRAYTSAAEPGRLTPAAENADDGEAANIVADNTVPAEASEESAVTESPACDEVIEDTDDADPQIEVALTRGRTSPRCLAAIATTVVIVALGGVVGWLAMQQHHSQQASGQRAEYLQAARQGAVNLTTIDWQHVDGDVKRIVDSATGTFYDDFSKRAQPFIDVVKQVQSKTTGTVTMAGLESVSGDHAQALVAITVETTNTAAPQPVSKAWRMRIDMQRVGNDVKVANVEFVP